MDNIDPATFAALFAALDPERTGIMRDLEIGRHGGDADAARHRHRLAAASRSARSMSATISSSSPSRATIRCAGWRRAARCAILDHDPGDRRPLLRAVDVGLLPALIAGSTAAALREGAASVLDAALGAATPREAPPALGAALAGRRSTSAGHRHHGADALCRPARVFRSAGSASSGRRAWARTARARRRSAPWAPSTSTASSSSISPARPTRCSRWSSRDIAGQGERMAPDLAGDRDARLSRRPAAWATCCDAEAARHRDEPGRRNGRPTRRFQLERLDEQSLGALMMHFMLETIIAADLLGRRRLRPARGRGRQGAGAAISWRDGASQAHNSRHGASAYCRRTSSTASPPARWSSGRPRAVKELVENAIDAGARAHRRRAAGRRPHSLIAVGDDGIGMTREELALAVERHCTSKLPDDDLLRHPHARLPRRGAAVDRRGEPPHASPRRVRGASDGVGARPSRAAPRASAQPAARPPGTRVEVRDLFFATPARLKFLKDAAHRVAAMWSTRCERLAMAHPAIAFRLESEERTLLDLAGGQSVAAGTSDARGWSGWPRSWAANSPTTRCAIDADARGLPPDRLRRPADAQPRRRRAPVSLRQRPAGARQAADRRGARRLPGFPGARPPSDGGAVPRRRRPTMVDVNVHPAKTEVRFRDAGTRARPDRRRAAHRARRRRPSRLDDGRPTPPWARSGRTPAIRRRCRLGRAMLVLDPARPRRGGEQFMAPLGRAVGRAPTRPSSRSNGNGASTIRSAWRARSCTRPTSSRRPTRAS